MEQGPVQQIFDAPAHSYTQVVAPEPQGRKTRGARSKDIVAPRSSFADLSKTYQVKRRGRVFHSEIDVHAGRGRRQSGNPAKAASSGCR